MEYLCDFVRETLSLAIYGNQHDQGSWKPKKVQQFLKLLLKIRACMKSIGPDW